MPDPEPQANIADQLLDWFSALSPDEGIGKQFLDKLADFTNIGMSKGFEKFAQGANLASFGLGQTSAVLSPFQARPGLESELIEGYSDIIGTRALLVAEEKTLGPQRQFMKDVSEQYAAQAMGIQEELQKYSGMNARAVDSLVYGVETITKKSSDRAYDMMRNLEARQITTIDGVKRTISEIDLEPAKVTFARFNEVLLKDSQLTYAATEAMGTKSGENIALALALSEERLHVSRDQLNELFQVEFSETGKISGKYIEEQQKVALAASRLYGANMLQVTDDINAMMADFENFGQMGQSEMTALSITMGQLGLKISDVTSAASKFSSFDSAIQVVSNLSAATGATLDTMKLFELSASGDMQGFIVELRDQLDAAGLEFEDLDGPLQKYIAKQLSLDPRKLQRLMNDNIELAEVSAEELDEAMAGITSEETTAAITGMARTGLDTKTPSDIAKRQLENININKETALTIENVYNVSQAQMLKSYTLAASKLEEQSITIKTTQRTINEIIAEMNKGINVDTKIADLSKKLNTPIATVPAPETAVPTTTTPAIPGAIPAASASTDETTPTREMVMNINLAGSPDITRLMDLLGLNLQVDGQNLTFTQGGIRYTIKTDSRPGTSP